MKHGHLIDLTNFFVTEDESFKKISDAGVCYGFTSMAINAALLNEQKHFNERLTFLDDVLLAKHDAIFSQLQMKKQLKDSYEKTFADMEKKSAEVGYLEKKVKNPKNEEMITRKEVKDLLAIEIKKFGEEIIQIQQTLHSQNLHENMVDLAKEFIKRNSDSKVLYLTKKIKTVSNIDESNEDTISRLKEQEDNPKWLAELLGNPSKLNKIIDAIRVDKLCSYDASQLKLLEEMPAFFQGIYTLQKGMSYESIDSKEKTQNYIKNSSIARPSLLEGTPPVLINRSFHALSVEDSTTYFEQLAAKIEDDKVQMILYSGTHALQLSYNKAGHKWMLLDSNLLNNNHGSYYQELTTEELANTLENALCARERGEVSLKQGVNLFGIEVIGTAANNLLEHNIKQLNEDVLESERVEYKIPSKELRGFDTTILSLAVKHGSLDDVKKLIACGALIESDVAERALKRADSDILNELLKTGDSSARSLILIHHPLGLQFVAASSPKYLDLAKMAIKFDLNAYKFVDPSVRNDAGFLKEFYKKVSTPLKSGDVEIIRTLKKEGAQFDLSNPDIKGAVKALIENRDLETLNELQGALTFSPDTFTPTDAEFLIMAVNVNDPKMFEQLMTSGVDVKQVDLGRLREGEAPLLASAIILNHRELVKLLLKNGVEQHPLKFDLNQIEDLDAVVGFIVAKVEGNVAAIAQNLKSYIEENKLGDNTVSIPLDKLAELLGDKDAAEQLEQKNSVVVDDEENSTLPVESIDESNSNSPQNSSQQFQQYKENYTETVSPKQLNQNKKIDPVSP